MKTELLLTSLLLDNRFPVLAQAGTVDSLLEKLERAKWLAIETADSEQRSSSAPPQPRGQHGQSQSASTGNLPATISTSPDLPLGHVTISDFQVQTPSPDIKILTYKAEEPVNLFVSSTWIKRNGIWETQHYQTKHCRPAF
jgi:hypothetical protein